jgi:endonuclease-3
VVLTATEIIDRLNAIYGQPEWRPHGDATAELVLTLLSQNTSDLNSGRAFAALLSRYPDWTSVMTAETTELVEVLRPGGLAQTKAPRLQAMLREVEARCGSFDLSFLKDLPLDEAKAWLRSIVGVGPKTAACVLLFALGRPALPVDTHVHRVAVRLGLVPSRVSAERAHELLESLLSPDEVYAFHVDLIKHGRRTCFARRPACERCVLRADCPSAGAAVLGGTA